MLIPVPSWVTRAREKLDKVVDDLVRKNGVDWTACRDSRAIEEGKETIVNALWRIYESTNVEERKRLNEHFKDMDKKEEKKW